MKEDVLLTVSRLISKLGPDFDRYLIPIKPHLLAGLQNAAEADVCGVCVGCIGDLASIDAGRRAQARNHRGARK